MHITKVDKPSSIQILFVDIYLFGNVNAATDSSNHDVVVVGQLGKLSGLKHILVKFVVIDNWENNLKMRRAEPY